MNTNYIDLVKECKNIFISLGYEKIKEKEYNDYIEISFRSPWDLGYDGFKNRHKDAIRMLLKGYLFEFDYSNDTHYVRINKELKGLDPDDDRYGCLYYETIKILSTFPKSNDIFINYGDHVSRFVRG